MTDSEKPTITQAPTTPPRKGRRKRGDGAYVSAGRTPKNPLEKLKLYVRFTCNKGFKETFLEIAKSRDLNESDYLRLAVYNQLVADGKMTEELKRNPTWETLWNRGVVPLPPFNPLYQKED